MIFSSWFGVFSLCGFKVLLSFFILFFLSFCLLWPKKAFCWSPDCFTFWFKLSDRFVLSCGRATEHSKKTERHYPHQITHKPPKYILLKNTGTALGVGAWTERRYFTLHCLSQLSQIILYEKKQLLTHCTSLCFFDSDGQDITNRKSDCTDTEFNCCCCVSCWLCVLCLWELYILFNLNITDICSLGMNNHSCELNRHD